MQKHRLTATRDSGGKSRRVRARRGGRLAISMLTVISIAAIAAAAPEVLMGDAANVAGIRAARLSNVEGGVQLLRGTSTEFQQALLNMPLVEGSRLVTSNDGRAEVQFEDGSIARITPNSTLNLNVLRRNSDGSMITEAELLSGLGYFELKPAAGQQLDAVRFGTNLFTASSSAVLRINRDAEPAEIAVLAGGVHVEGGTLFNVDVHSNETIRFDATDPSRYYLGDTTGSDSWDQWNLDRDQALSQAASQQTVAAAGHGDPENPAWSDLDASGSWYAVPGYGSVWTPAGVGSGWDPYGLGNWAYYPGYGYTWVSGYSWGWLPYRCGGWNYFAAFGWGWLPGSCGYGLGGGYGYIGGYGYGGGYGDGGWGSGVVVYSSPRGYNPPPRPVFKGPAPRVVSSQRVIPVDRGVNARSITPVTIVGSKTPRTIIYAGQHLEPISAKYNPGRGTLWGNPLHDNGTQRSGPVTPVTPAQNRPWFVQGSEDGGSRSGAHQVQHAPATPANPSPPGSRGSGIQRPGYQVPGNQAPGNQAPGYQPQPSRLPPPYQPQPSRPSMELPPQLRPAPAPSAPVAPHYSAPPSMPSAPAPHVNPAPAPAPAAPGRR